MIHSYFIGKKRNYRGREEKAPFSLVKKTAIDAILALIMPIIIIGGIMSGVFTATESGAMAVFYALVVSMFIYKELTIRDIIDCLIDCSKATAQVLIVVAFASLFTWLITINLLPQQITAFLSDTINNPIILLMVINIILLIAGTFIDTTSALIIFAPLFLPLIRNFGIDTIHFGVLLAVNLTIGMCTPPLGVCLFVSGSIAKVSLVQQMRDLLPMIGVLIIVLLMVTYVPQLVLFLPNLLM